MDNVVKMIYEGILREPHLRETLVVLLGDHGMDQHGNHGGDTPGELASAMTLISPLFEAWSKKHESPLKNTADYKYYSVINQVDIVPTLASLLGFSIPVNNIGVFVSELLDIFPTAEQKLRALLDNAEQMAKSLVSETAISSPDISACDPYCRGCHTEEKHIFCLREKVITEERKWNRRDNESARVLRLAIHDVSHPKSCRNFF